MVDGKLRRRDGWVNRSMTGGGEGMARCGVRGYDGWMGRKEGERVRGMTDGGRSDMKGGEGGGGGESGS